MISLEKMIAPEQIRRYYSNLTDDEKKKRARMFLEVFPFIVVWLQNVLSEEIEPAIVDVWLKEFSLLLKEIHKEEREAEIKITL